jgi:lipoprotein-anchoring transpeptidase ErfK/SrfK
VLRRFIRPRQHLALLAAPILGGLGLPAPVPAQIAAQPVPPGTTAVRLGPAVEPSAPAANPAPTGVSLVLDRRQRLLKVYEAGRELRRFPAAVGMAGWETPTGSFTVLEMRTDPIWEHPQSGKLYPPGAANPLGSRWIGFHRDCSGRRGWDGERMLDVKGCVVAGFHGTPHRWTVGRAVSHGCVRLYDEDVRELFDLVQVGTPVKVLP